MVPPTLTKASLIEGELGHLFTVGGELRSHLLAQGYRQADLCELVSLPTKARVTRKVLLKGMSFIDGTLLAEDTEVSALVPEQPLVLKFFQGKGSGKSKNAVRVHLIARLFAKDIEALLPVTPCESVPESNETLKARKEFILLDGLGLFD